MDGKGGWGQGSRGGTGLGLRGGKGHPTPPERDPRGSRRPVRPSARADIEGVAVRKCISGPESPPPQQPLFLNFNCSEGAAGEGSPPSGPASSSASPRRLDLSPSRLCVAPGIPEGAPAPGSACGPFSMAAASLGCLGVFAEAASGQDRDPAAHHAQPGPAGNDSEAGRSGEGRGWLAWWPARLGVAGRLGSNGPGRDLAPCRAPAQSPPRPNPIVPPGLGLAPPLARTKCDAGRVTSAVPGDGAAARPSHPLRPRPEAPGLKPPDTSPVVSAEGPLRLREGPHPVASPCSRALVRAAAREVYVGSALVTHPPLGLGGGSGLGSPQSHLGARELRLWGLGGSFKSKFSPKPTSNKILKEGHRETPKWAGLSLCSILGLVSSLLL